MRQFIVFDMPILSNQSVSRPFRAEASYLFFMGTAGRATPLELASDFLALAPSLAGEGGLNYSISSTVACLKGRRR